PCRLKRSTPEICAELFPDGTTTSVCKFVCCNLSWSKEKAS
ncbi:hypothetical protein Taro_037097, partial [Colocasia esculenta]|nr:hypothetical protein [Colocasia esculenta]